MEFEREGTTAVNITAMDASDHIKVDMVQSLSATHKIPV